MKLKKIKLAVAIASVLVAGQAFAHQTYNITYQGSSGLGIANSVNNTDGISNFGGYSQGGGTAAANHWIPGTGALPADYSGTLPFNWYAGHHDTTLTATTTRTQYTGATASDANSLWKAAYTDTSNTWAAYAPATTNSTTDPNAHPYLAVGGNSWQVGSTAGGLDYGLIHASCGANTSVFNCATPSAAVGGYYDIKITVARDASYNTQNDPNALLSVALYRGADASLTSSRTAAFDPNAAGVQGSTLGTGGANGYAELWTATQTSTSSVLSYDLKIDASEWAKTDALNGTGLNDGIAGYYTLIIGASGGAAGSALAYDVTSVSVSAVPVPGAFWLFASAMGGLGVLRRRKAVNA